jgi:hypothetical protein
VHTHLTHAGWVDIVRPPALLEAQRLAVTETSGDLQSQQQAVAQALLALEAAAAQLAEVAAINDEVAQAGIDQNEHTTLSFEVSPSAITGPSRCMRGRA